METLHLIKWIKEIPPLVHHFIPSPILLVVRRTHIRRSSLILLQRRGSLRIFVTKKELRLSYPPISWLSVPCRDLAVVVIVGRFMGSE